jgi:hypothetical protein
MIKRIVQKIKTKKNGEIGEILRRPDMKKKAGQELSLGRELKSTILNYEQLFSSVFSTFHGQKFIFFKFIFTLQRPH